METVSGIIVVAVGVGLIGFAGMIFVKPLSAERFITSFASSARAHYTEQAVRLVAGTAMVIFSGRMQYPDIFEVFGWIITITSVGLFLIPWRLHHTFGKWAVPLVIGHLRLYGVAAGILGAVIIFCTFPFDMP